MVTLDLGVIYSDSAEEAQVSPWPSHHHLHTVPSSHLTHSSKQYPYDANPPAYIFPSPLS